MYPAGLIGWKLAAKMGLPILTRFAYGYDEEAEVYIAKALYLKGIYAEGKTLEEVFTNIKLATHDILEIELDGKVSELTPEYREVSDLSFACV